MRSHGRRVALLILLACLPPVGAGCAGLAALTGQPAAAQPTETQQAVTTVDKAIALQKSYRLAADAVAAVAPHLSADQRKATRTALNAGSGVLDRLDAAIGDGTKPIAALTFADLSGQLAPYLQQLLQAQVDGERARAAREAAAKATPATRPAAAPKAKVTP